MTVKSVEQLRQKKCVPCEGGVPPVSREEAHATAQRPARLAADGGWPAHPPRMGREEFPGRDGFLQPRGGELAEDEGHHPDLHLVGYRHVAIELWTHAIGGLSENDFITAAKIDLLPLQLKPT